MSGWNKYPFFRLIIPFIAGILPVIYVDFPISLHRGYLLIILVLMLLITGILFRLRSWKLKWVFGVSMNVLLFCTGFTLAVFHTPKYDPENISNYVGDANTFTIRIAEPLTEKENSYKAEGELIYAHDSAGLVKVSGSLLIYFQKDSSLNEIEYGDILWMNARIQEVEPPGNPHQFDYRKFLANSGIYHQVYLKNDQWKETGQRKPNKVFQLAHQARFTLLDILHDNGLKGDEYAVVSAILLGYDDFMDRELRDKYAGAGALHVLCVSGLHVGIIFFMLSFLLKPLDRKKYLRLLKVFLLLISIWAYAFITGLSPSVMRASVMFSLFAFREAYREKSDPYNTLAASAFVLLFIDPYMITKIGFQLSYSAVLAIISLFNPIYSLMPMKNPLLDYLWKLTVVSLAAQIGTFPFAIFYFHQFPVYFFLTNIIVIPLVWLILNTGIAVLFFAVVSQFLSVHFGVDFVNFLSVYLGIVLSFLLLALNKAVEYINNMPGATVSGLVLTFTQVILIYVIIILLNRSLWRKNAAWLVVAVSLMMVFTVSILFQKLERVNQREIVIYQVNNYTGMDFIMNSRACFVADSGLIGDRRSIDFNISGNRIYSGITGIEKRSVDDPAMKDTLLLNGTLQFYQPCFYNYFGKRLAVIDNSSGLFHPDYPLHIDWLILRNNPKFSMRELNKQFRYNRVVFDGSMNWWQANKMKAWCDSTGHPYHDIRKEGCYKIEL
jgi:competence protein ComEC